jgi:hypothetical protein
VVAGLVIGVLVSGAIGGQSEASGSRPAVDSKKGVTQVLAIAVPALVRQESSDGFEELKDLGFAKIVFRDFCGDESHVGLSSERPACDMKPEFTGWLPNPITLWVS